MMATDSSPVKPSALRLLILSPSSEPTRTPLFPSFLEALTGTQPSNGVTSFAGYTSHPPLRLRTKYYSSDVSIWCDELPPPTTQKGSKAEQEAQPVVEADANDDHDSELQPGAPPLPNLATWKDQILSPFAREVRDVIGGIVLLLPVTPTTLPTFQPVVEAIHALREAVEDECPGRDIASLVVLQETSKQSLPRVALGKAVEDLEETCITEGILGWDIVSWNGLPPTATNDEDSEKESRNVFGEKTGIARAREVIEAIDWTISPTLGLDDLDLIFDHKSEDSPSTDVNPDITSMFKDGKLPFDADLEREFREFLDAPFCEADLPDILEHPPFRSSSFPNPDDPPEPTGSSAAEDKKNEAQVDEMPAFLERLIAIREAGSEMSREERERFAMRELKRIIEQMD
jgi:hypothetical protein